MNTPELLTRGTVWLALGCYVLALLGWAGGKAGCAGRTRMAWLCGCIFFLAHVAAAFHFHHQWSHALAVEDTRRETVARTGLNYSGGIYFNYLFALIWLADVAGWLMIGKMFSERSRAWFIALHVFFLFMIFNATVIFGRGWARPAGAMVCLLAAVALWGWWRNNSAQRNTR